jgi:ankyrin repeat protein
LDAGADVNAPEQHGDRRTPLLAASWAAEAAVVGALLDAGADVTAADAEGRTTAHVLARQGETSVLEAALRHKAAGPALLRLLAHRDSNGLTPIAAAVDAQQFDTATACLSAVAAAGDAELAAAVSASLNDEPNPLLMVAADSVTAWQNGAVLRLIDAALQAGADPRIVIEETADEEEQEDDDDAEAAAPTTTPLHSFAAIEAASRAFDMLLKHAAALERRDGASTDEKGWGDAFRDGANRSLLHAACDEAAVSNMRLIIDSGACRAPTAEALAADGAVHLQELRAYGENAIALVAGAQRGEQRNALKKLLDRCEEAALVLQTRGFATKDAVKSLVDGFTAAVEAAAQKKAEASKQAAAPAASAGDYSGRSHEQLEAEKALARADVRAKIAAANRQHRDAKEARRSDKADADADDNEAGDSSNNTTSQAQASAGISPTSAGKGGAGAAQEASAPLSMPAIIMALLVAVAVAMALWS